MTASIVVIGAGIVGTSAAFHLADAGARVTVVDAAVDGAATPAGAGIASPFTLDDKGTAWTELMFAATHYLADLDPELGSASGRTVAGELVVAGDAEEASRLPSALAWVEARIEHYGTKAIGSPQLLDADAVAALHPLLSPTHGAIHLPGVAQVDGRTLTASLRRAAVARGARFVAGEAALSPDGAGVRVTVDATAMPADQVVLAAGAWTDRLLAPFGRRAGIHPQRGQILHARIAGLPALPIVTGFGNNYLLTFEDGRLVFGPTREDSSGFDRWSTVGGVAGLIDDAVRLAPGISGATWVETRSGLRPASEDGAPTFGRPAGVDGLVIASGLGAYGLTVGTFAGRIAADLALGRQRAVAAEFAPDRWTS